METIKIQKHIELVTSTLTIVEMHNVIKREQRTFSREAELISSNGKAIDLLNLSLVNQFLLVIEYSLRYYNIIVLEDNDTDLMSIQNKWIKFNPVFKLALNLHSGTKLRTLDLLHFCHAKYFTEYKDLPIHYLVTSDITFQSEREYLRDDSSIVIISPESLIEIEC